MDEPSYIAGRNAAWQTILGECLRALGYEGAEAGALVDERVATIAMLRQVCAEHGDNDWPDDLHLADVIEKHLWRHLEDEAADGKMD